MKKTKEHFQQALADDINISLALSCIFELLREMNALIDQNLIGKEDAKEILKLLEEFDQVLAVLPLEPSEIKIPQEIQIAMQKREKAREEKNWKLADELREYIYSEGYFIEDTPSGLRVKKTL